MNVIAVRLKIKPSLVREFEREMRRHIAWTRANEPGCLVFEVAKDAREPGTYHVFEVFRDDLARDEHARSPSLAVLDEAVGPWIEERVQHDAASLVP
jgi:autoinducer 2-degrading protein